MKPTTRRARSIQGNGAGSLALVPTVKRSRQDGASLAPALRRQVLASFARRSPRERLILALLLYERLSADEVANVIGISSADVNRAYRMMLAKMRDVAPRGEEAYPDSARAAARSGSERRRRAA